MSSRMSRTLRRTIFVLIVAALGTIGAAAPQVMAQISIEDETIGYENPIYEHNAPDPVMVQDGSEFYTYTTQSFYGDKKVRVPVLRSSDLVEWEFAGDALASRPAWALKGPRSDFWAPHVVRNGEDFLLYFSARHRVTKSLAIGVAVAGSPLGPFVDKGRPLLKGSGFTTIDPFVLAAGDASYMYWGSGGQPIRAQQLSADGLRLVGDAVTVLRPDPSREYEGLVEGPWIIERDGYFYLFYSGDRCCYDSAHYAVMVARSTDPLSRFKRHAHNPILEQNTAFRAPGHNSSFVDAAGRHWMLYHAMVRGSGSLDRHLMLDPIDWDEDGWPMINGGKGPSTSSSDRPALAIELSW